ncbi:TPA: hypothetical protein DEP21_05930 [Patescibacteria group bacterium]|nr:hypothetical protein [Candidatus Gracilibacteria bacterium]
MYTSIKSSITFSDKVYAGLLLDKDSLEILVETCIKHINRSISSYKRSKTDVKKDKKQVGISKYDFTHQVGVSWEIIEKAIYLGLSEKDLKLSKKSALKIKNLAIKLENFIYKLGKFDSDFISMDETNRARPSEEFLDYIKKVK